MENISVKNAEKKMVWNFIDAKYDKRFLVKDGHQLTKLVYVSTLFESKGIIDLCQWFIHHAPANCILDIYGNADKNMLLKMQKFQEINGGLRYHGLLTSKDDIIEVLRESSFFVLPTRYPNEAAPRSLIEAISQGCSVITTNHAGIPDLLDGCPHTLILETSMLQQSSLVRRFIETTIVDFRVRNQIRNYYESKFDLSSLQAQLIEIFN